MWPEASVLQTCHLFHDGLQEWQLTAAGMHYELKIGPITQASHAWG